MRCICVLATNDLICRFDNAPPWETCWHVGFRAEHLQRVKANSGWLPQLSNCGIVSLPGAITHSCGRQCQRANPRVSTRTRSACDAAPRCAFPASNRTSRASCITSMSASNAGVRRALSLRFRPPQSATSFSCSAKRRFTASTRAEGEGEVTGLFGLSLQV
jgi:hypothetical protein